jgi:hypothetical protein
MRSYASFRANCFESCYFLDNAIWQARRKEDRSTTENNRAVIAKFLEEVINQNQMDRANDLVLEDLWSWIRCRDSGKEEKD